MKKWFFLILIASLVFPQDRIGVKCPFDQTYVENSNKKVFDKKTNEIMIQYVCGGITEHEFLIKERKKEDRSLESIAGKILENLPKPRDKATLQELALYNRIMILLTWISLQSSENF